MAMMTFSVEAHSESPTKTVAKARGFDMIIDEPEELGGSNEGPNPVEFMLGSLSGCLNVVCHMIAEEMGFELRGVKISLEGQLNPERLFGSCMDERAGYQNISVRITPDTDADEETLKTWLKAVEGRCPVSDNVCNPTPVVLDLG